MGHTADLSLAVVLCLSPEIRDWTMTQRVTI